MSPDHSLVYAFIALFVIMDPVGTAAIFAGLTHGMGEALRRRMAIRAVLVAGTTMLFFAIAGDALLTALGISLPSLRIAGGILLLLLAIDMVVVRQTGLRALTESENREADHDAHAHRDISVFPLAIPLIAGPGALTTMVLLVGRAGGWTGYLGLALVVALVLAITLGLLLTAARIVRVLGMTGVNVVSRVLGILLAAFAVQLILDGLAQGLPLASRG